MPKEYIDKTQPLEGLIADIKSRWEPRFQFQEVKKENLPNYNLKRVSHNKTVDCMDDRLNQDGTERNSRKLAGASLGKHVLAAIKEAKNKDFENLTKTTTLTAQIKESLDEGRKFYWHDAVDAEGESESTGCGFHDHLEEILRLYLEKVEGVNATKIDAFVSHFLEEGKSSRKRINEISDYARGQMDNKDLVVKISHLEGSHSAKDVFINGKVDCTLVPQDKEGDKHFILDPKDDPMQIELGLATMAILSEEKQCDVYWVN